MQCVHGIAILCLHSAQQILFMHCFMQPPLLSAASTTWRYIEPTIHYQTTTVFVELTITVSMLEQPLHTPDSRTQPVATDLASPLTPVQLNLPLMIGMAHSQLIITLQNL